jgi:hypothetical protein
MQDRSRDAAAGIAALRRSSEQPGPGSAGAVAEARRLAPTAPDDAGPAWRTFVDPRRWPLHRLVGLAVLNGAVAAGIAIGFNPLP